MELGRITGLDPADPHFEDTDPIIRLDESDAFYVDIIHTDANPILSGLKLIRTWLNPGACVMLAQHYLGEIKHSD